MQNKLILDASIVPDLVGLFLEDAGSGTWAARTRRNYRNKLAPFVEWSAGYDQLQPQHFAQFASWLQCERVPNFTTNTAASVVDRIKRLLRWSFENELIDSKLYLAVPSLPRTSEKDRRITVSEAARLFEAVDGCRWENRVKYRCLLSLLFGAGLERDELLRIPVDGITFFDNGGGSLRIEGRKPRMVAFGGGAAPFIAAQMAESADGWLLPAGGGDGLYKVLWRLCQTTGVQRIAIRDCRRWFGLYWLTTFVGDPALCDDLLLMQLGNVSKMSNAVLDVQLLFDNFCSPMEEIAVIMDRCEKF